MSGSKSNAQSKQVSHCAVGNSYHDAKFQSADDRSAYECGQRCVTGVLSASGNTGDTGVQAGAEAPSHGSEGVGLQRAASVFTDSPSPGAQNDVISNGVVADELVIHNSVVNAGNCVDSFLSDGCSELRYLDVSIDGIPNVIRGLDDSGAQICLIRADVIAVMNLPRIGKLCCVIFWEIHMRRRLLHCK